MKQLMKFQAQKKITEQIYLVHGNALLPFHLQINYNDASFHLQNHLSTLLFPIVVEGKNQILSIVSAIKSKS